MPETRSPTATVQFTVTVPQRASDLMEALVPIGLYGSTRAEVARALILARLEDVVAKGIIRVD
jgi:hypothetical protein